LHTKNFVKLLIITQSKQRKYVIRMPAILRYPNISVIETIKKDTVVARLVKIMVISNKISFTSHTAEGNPTSAHKAVNKASKDRNFIVRALSQLESLKFPAYKYQILDYAKMHSVDNDVITLLQSLDDTMLYHSKFNLKKALEQENPEAKKEHQISEGTRKNLNVQNIDRRQKRKDYPETPATGMKNYICNYCGKEFQSGDQLQVHREFEFMDKSRD
jgi:hypothetical protein